jgi:hypothetical protein
MTPCWLVATCLELLSTANQDLRPMAPALNSRGDGVYGRFDTDLDAGLGAGASLVKGAPALELRASLHHYSTAGVFLGASLPLDDSAQAGTALAFGVDLRPAFLPRWSENLEQGPARLDLLLDSISLALGPYFRFAEGGEARGLELSMGVGLPLLRHTSGPWLEARAVSRFPDDDETARLGAMLLLTWHQGFASPWLDDDVSARY